MRWKGSPLFVTRMNMEESVRSQVSSERLKGKPCRTLQTGSPKAKLTEAERLVSRHKSAVIR